MIELQSEELANVAYYKKAKFTFKPGITCIVGDNRNARVKNATNGAGKSSLFTPLHTALGYEAPIIKGRQGQKDIFGTGTAVGLILKKNKVTWKITRKGSKYTVFKNGKDLGIKKQAIALEKIAYVRGLTQAQFYSTVYLDSSRPNIFQAGTSSERLAFFTDLFGLHDIDKVRTQCRALLNEAVHADREIQRLRGELKDLPKADLETANTEYQALVKVQDKAQRLLRVFTKNLHLLDLWEKHEKVASHVKELEVATKGHTLDSVKAKLRQIEEQKAAQAEYRVWIKKKKELKQRLLEVQKKTGLNSLKAARVRLQELQELAGVEVPEKPEPLDDKEKGRATKLLVFGDDVEAAQDKLKQSVTEVEGRLRELLELQRELQPHVGDSCTTCPLCQTQLKAEHFKALNTRLKEEHATLKTKLATLRSSQEALQKYADFNADMKEYKKAKAVRAKYSEQEHANVRAFVKTADEWKAHLEDQVEVPFDIPDGQELERVLDQLKELQAIRKFALPEDAEDMLRSFAKTNGLAFSVPLLRTYIKDKEEVWVTKLRESNDKIPQLRSVLDIGAANNQKRKSLLKQIQELKEAVADLPELRLLVDAYSTGGVKSLIVKRLAASIERNLNAVAPAIQHEPIRYELIVNEKEFHVIAHRKFLGKIKTSDVRMLSGAERRMFILTMLLASLPLLPEAKRYDTLILDEPFNNLDEPNYLLMRDKLLPKLLEVVPKVVVIVTKRDHIPSGAHVVTAVKTGNETVLQ